MQERSKPAEGRGDISLVSEELPTHAPECFWRLCEDQLLGNSHQLPSTGLRYAVLGAEQPSPDLLQDAKNAEKLLRPRPHGRQCVTLRCAVAGHENLRRSLPVERLPAERLPQKPEAWKRGSNMQYEQMQSTHYFTDLQFMGYNRTLWKILKSGTNLLQWRRHRFCPKELSEFRMPPSKGASQQMGAPNLLKTTLNW